MAEAVGLAIGAVSLAGLFTTCIECIDYIGLVRDHGHDYETSVTKLILLKARLNAWGQSLLVTQRGRENAALRDRWLEEREIVGKCLIGIKDMFEDAKLIESRYGLKPTPAGVVAVSIPQEQRSSALQQIRSVFTSETEQKQDHVSWLKKTRWAIHDKKKFDSMIANLAFFIGGLEDLSGRLQVLDLQQQLLQVQIQSVTDTESVNLMEEAVNQTQTIESSQVTDDGNSQRNPGGHTYIGTVIKDRSKVLNGNIGHQSQTSHLYQHTQVSDDAHVVQGDMSNEAALSFFK